LGKTALAVLVLATGSLLDSARADPADETFFRDQVAPIFRARCVGCHGGQAPKGHLALTSGDTLRKGGVSGQVVVPGKPQESLLLDMITGDEPEMPRKGEKLAPEQVARIRSWIEHGATWPRDLVIVPAQPESAWWSLGPLAHAAIPRVRNSAWLRTPVDAFVLARLEHEGLEPSPEADRRTLVRRLTFDLHGLPPTPEEVNAFLEDTAPDAYERLVDRLLASPRYGERWGRHWLDQVHYADTHGYDKDKRRDHAWPYRDYVIRALNADIPYSRFVQEQVAGDVLFPGDPVGLIATGFLAAGPWDFVGHVELGEGTVEKAKTRLLDRDDMVSNTISTFLSLTVHCARCHDHKFDPIPQADYYRLQAVFAGVDRGDRPCDLDRATGLRRYELEARNTDLARRIDALLDDQVGPLRDVGQEEVAGWQKLLADLDQAEHRPASPTNGYHSAIASSPDTTKWVQLDLGRAVAIDEIRLVPARPTDFPDAPGFGFPVRFVVEAGDDSHFDQAATVADHSQVDFPFPGDQPLVIRLAGRTARYVRVTASRLWMRTNDYVFALAETQVISGGRNVARGAVVEALDSIEAGRWSKQGLVDGFDSRKALEGPRGPSPLGYENRVGRLRAGLAEAEERQRALIEAMLDAPSSRRLSAWERERAAVASALRALPPPDRVYTALPHPPRPVHVLMRGDVEHPAGEVGAGALACIDGLEPVFALADPGNEGARRAALALWLVRPANALLWRSIVNRVWHHHFGSGLVATPNDFGRNGSAPSHPELLDWLALEFQRRGQSLKALHRLLVCSAVYRQASSHRPSAARVDADNRLLWRMNRQRLDAESVRDAVLAVSGTLDSKMGGPGFEVFRFKDDHSPIYDHSAIDKINDPRTWRRTVYRFAVRSSPNPFLECLDAADPNTSTPVRNETITALQALALLNDPFMMEQAKRFASRLEVRSSRPAAQVDAAFRLAFSRDPDPEERAALVSYINSQGAAAACRMIFNLNEFMFVD